MGVNLFLYKGKNGKRIVFKVVPGFILVPLHVGLRFGNGFGHRDGSGPTGRINSRGLKTVDSDPGIFLGTIHDSVVWCHCAGIAYGTQICWVIPPTPSKQNSVEGGESTIKLKEECRPEALRGAAFLIFPSLPSPLIRRGTCAARGEVLVFKYGS